jgi:hypothetical protein
MASIPKGKNMTNYAPLKNDALKNLEDVFSLLITCSCIFDIIERDFIEDSFGPDYDEDNPPPLESEIIEAAKMDIDRACSAIKRILKIHGRITELEKQEPEPIQDADIPF